MMWMYGGTCLIFEILTGSKNGTDSKGGGKYYEGISNGDETESWTREENAWSSTYGTTRKAPER